MRTSSRFILAATLAAGLAAAALPSPADAAFTTTEQKCRSTIAKGGGKYAKAALKAITGCHKNRDKDGAFSGTNCNSIDAADPLDKVATAAGKYGTSVAAKCTGVTADVLYTGCPAPCDGTVPVVNTFAQVVSCETCLTDAATQDYSDDAFGLPTSPITDPDLLKCHTAITKSGSKLYNDVLKNITKCQGTAEKGGSESITNCTVTTFNSLVQTSYDKCLEAVTKGCTAATPPYTGLDACATTGLFDLTVCVCDEARQSAKALVTEFLKLDPPPAPTTTTSTTSTTSTTTTSTTVTTTTLVGDPLCPDVGEIVLYSRDSKIACTDNTDCALPRTCDTDLGTCATIAGLDSGWTGGGLGADINDGITTRGHLYCPGPGPVCGECQVTGIDPEPGNCRCRNDSRTICENPFGTDNTNCTGPGSHACDCYFGSPFPLVSGNTAACIVNRFAQNISGTANVDLGSGEISASLRTRVYLGPDSLRPCPTCGGKCSDDNSACNVNSDCGMGPVCNHDPIPGDFMREGICIGGDNDGQTCDPGGVNASFPIQPNAPGGGDYSLDCMPSSATGVSGSGLSIVLNQTTGSVSLPATVDCNGPLAGTTLCPCLVCSKDQSVPCHQHSDCTAQGGSCSKYKSPTTYSCFTNTDCEDQNYGPCGTMLAGKCDGAYGKICTTNADCEHVNNGPTPAAGLCDVSTCSAKGSVGVYPLPNKCDGGLCSDIGGGHGECTTGPDEYYCSATMTATGTSTYGCDPLNPEGPNADCSVSSIGIDGGTCTVVTRRKCLLDPITATGVEDPEFPVAVAAFCIPPTSSGGINSAAGLPGPGRVVSQAAAKTYCPDHVTEYDPGVGGCP